MAVSLAGTSPHSCSYFPFILISCGLFFFSSFFRSCLSHLLSFIVWLTSFSYMALKVTETKYGLQIHLGYELAILQNRWSTLASNQLVVGSGCIECLAMRPEV